MMQELSDLEPTLRIWRLNSSIFYSEIKNSPNTKIVQRGLVS
jgi:hypothetical protein